MAEGVALLAEGVDRNNVNLTKKENDAVALLAEGVDRNGQLTYGLSAAACRPPRGGRG